MPQNDNEFTFSLRAVGSGTSEERRLAVPLTVGLDVYLEMLFQPTMPRSSIHPRVRRDLRGRGIVPSNAGALIRLSDLRIDGHPVPDLDVRVGLAASVIGVDGILGFDFFGSFAGIYMDTTTFEVTLTREK